ncbi:homeodomain-interacting protein kinase 1-like isoform X1 [Sander lucioperca]|uniref:homeodomain-interacting protein kinase 1-like isoform X1 n=1 Tax=Sander lucioperca TaxID=283035 RepID=UPI00125E6B3B|nr:homeodomain-interacting protein kinase 1-like isoform X1 [Sander lucioperca]
MDFQVFVGDLISSSSSQYEVQELLGCGSFGAVTQCRKEATNEMVALKIHKDKALIEEAKEEAAILHILKELGSDQFNIVIWHNSFTFEGRYYLEFEKLDISLTEFLQRSPSKSLELTDVRPIVQQLATALDFLKSTGIAHSDLKPDNIMMVDHLRQPLQVKVIDFGLALNHPEKWTGATLQTRWYRSPEILLGAPFNEAIDVWSLGCIAAEMLMGTVLFPGCDSYDMMRHIYLTVGKAPDHLLNAGMYTRQYFRPNYHILEPPFWTFMSSLEKRHYTFTPCTIKSLNDVMKASANLSAQDASACECDRVSFVDLLTKLLDVDAWQRIKPSQILQHPFITMSHLVGIMDNSLHLKKCVEVLSFCQDLSLCGGENVAKKDVSDSTAKEQPSLQSAVISGDNTLPKKRKGDGDEDSECGNKSPAKKRRRKGLDAAEKDAQISPKKSRLPKRKRDEADVPVTSDISSPAKRKKLKQVLSNTTRPGPALRRRGGPVKRLPVQKKKKPFPHKRRRGSLDGGE